MALKKLILFYLLFYSISGIANGLPNFTKYATKAQRQQLFFHYLTPIIINQDKKILAERRQLFYLYRRQQRTGLTTQQKAWLAKLANYYKVTAHGKERWQSLLRRVDIIPLSLALGQADKETASGTTRFARKGLNLYGMWCFKPHCGMVPLQRPRGESFQVKVYHSVAQSVAAYIHDLNTNPAYRIFRDLRAQQRQLGEPLSGVLLSSGLLAYSALHWVYINDVQQIIRNNHLERINRRVYS